MVKRGLPKGLLIVSLVLKCLSSRVGTFLLCGWVCLDWKFPFVHSFSELSLKKREAILQRWSAETLLLPLRISFVLLKIITLFVFFSLVNDLSACSLRLCCFQVVIMYVFVKSIDILSMLCCRLMKIQTTLLGKQLDTR